MKFTLSWLKDHLDTSATLQQICDTLTMIGLEVEQVIDQSTGLQAFTVAKILHAEQHPEADKLRVCRVLSDAGELQIVCGAPNARAGIFVALAKEGAVIPGSGMVIKKSKIRGVESNGMLCSRDELALDGDSQGIIELPEAEVGAPIAAVLGLDDPVIDINVTPNRGDALSVRGIARDLAAAGLGTLKRLSETANAKAFFASDAFEAFDNPVQVQVNTPHCAQFAGFMIRGVKNGQSPGWMQKKLTAIGQKSKSAIVDITNYMMIDMGNPMHAYDADRLSGHITVRKARDGESFSALNGVEYQLNETMTVIADDSGVIGLAGIIGGASTSCTAATNIVFLECARFDPINIAQTGRKLDILTDARYRFERGVDQNEGGLNAASIACYLIHDICGGKTSSPVTAGNPSPWERTIFLRVERVASLGGIILAKEQIEAIFTALEFRFVAATGGWQVTPPSWRADVEGEADLIEELLRISGYDNIPAIPLPKLPQLSKPALSVPQQRAQLAQRILATRGMLECCSWSFLPEAQAALFGGANPALKLVNPINAELDTMRPSLLPNLLEAARKNAFRGMKDIALFETGLQFSGITPEGQRMVSAGIRGGNTHAPFYQDGLFQQQPRAVDTFDAKADALSILHALGVGKCDVTTITPAWYHPGRSGALTLGGRIILGYFGELHPRLLPLFELESHVVAFEVFLDAIPVPRNKSGKARAALKLSDYQSVQRDFAFIVDANVTAATIIKALAQADKQLIADIALFDVYTGPGVEAGKKSVAVMVTLQASDRTLSEQDIVHVSQAIIDAAAKMFAGVLRQ